jgi:hypothetical protein
MFRKLIASLKPGAAAAPPAQPPARPGPYAQPEINALYELLFCDDRSLFRPRDGQPAAPWQALLFADEPDPAAVRVLADDPGNESRLRILAYNWLREHGLPVPPRLLLGVIVEVPLDQGLDVLAVYLDRRIRYINQSGRLAVFEEITAAMQVQVQALLAASQDAVDRIGPWDKPRLPPPQAGGIRLTFLASDGLYFGQGAFETMAREAMAAPIIQQATELLQLVVAMPRGGGSP